MQLQRCRMWLPEHICQSEPSSIGLVGWINCNHQCVDLVVAAICAFEHYGKLMTRLHSLSTKLPDELRKGDRPCLLGMIRCSLNSEELLSGVHAALAPRVWAELRMIPGQRKRNGFQSSPVLETLQIDGVSCKLDAHIILYDQPQRGSHHFCSCPRYVSLLHSTVQGESSGEENFLRQVDRIARLAKHQDASNMDLILLQLNSSRFIHGNIIKQRSTNPESLGANISSSTLWHFVAALLAVLGTFFFFLTRAGSVLLDIVHSKSSIGSHTVKILRHRCRQLKSWPITLFWGGPGPSLPDISVVHRLSVLKFTTGVALCVDIVLGVFSGIVLLLLRAHIEQCLWRVSQLVTNDILRSGCIWLMGVPAGFKLNTELTGALGTVSLQAVHTWSTLCYLVAPLLPLWLQLVAVSGMLMGFTIHLAVAVDMLLFLTSHISALHEALALLYSTQLRTLASLLRLFRGRKGNPLRRRLDSYNCTAEQIVVATLMFTPLLFLLPTISGFYMFFTLLHFSITVVSLTLQLLIQCVHVFPYVEIGIWILRPQKFPSGLCFQTSKDNPQVSVPKPPGRYHQYACGTAKVAGAGESSESFEPGFLHQQDVTPEPDDCDSMLLDKPLTTLQSRMGQRHATAGELLEPFFTHLYGGLGLSRLTSHIHRVLSGISLPATLSLECPCLPQASMRVAQFWDFCFEALAHAAGRTGCS